MTWAMASKTTTIDRMKDGKIEEGRKLGVSLKPSQPGQNGQNGAPGLSDQGAVCRRPCEQSARATALAPIRSSVLLWNGTS